MYGTLGTFGFLIETLPYPTFIPPGWALDSLYLQIKPGMTYLLDRAQGPGVTGIVRDSITNLPLQATVEILGFDLSLVVPRTSDSGYGRYRWLLQPGSYSLRVSHPLYYPKTVSFSVSGTGYTQVNVALVSRPSEPTIATTPESISDSLISDTLVSYSFKIANEGLDTLTFDITHNPNGWLNLSLDSGSVLPVDTSSIAVQVITDLLPAGTYVDTLVVSSNDPANPSKNVPVQITVFCLSKPMDANSSNDLTLADVIYIVNYIFKKPGFNLAYVCQGDLDSDQLHRNGKVDLADVIGLVNWILKSNPNFRPKPNRACCAFLSF